MPYMHTHCHSTKTVTLSLSNQLKTSNHILPLVSFDCNLAVTSTLWTIVPPGCGQETAHHSAVPQVTTGYSLRSNYVIITLRKLPQDCKVHSCSHLSNLETNITRLIREGESVKSWGIPILKLHSKGMGTADRGMRLYMCMCSTWRETEGRTRSPKCMPQTGSALQETDSLPSRPNCNKQL